MSRNRENMGSRAGIAFPSHLGRARLGPRPGFVAALAYVAHGVDNRGRTLCGFPTSKKGLHRVALPGESVSCNRCQGGHLSSHQRSMSALRDALAKAGR